ncbi:PPK2 family polyphosphate--nucleotide phosphotransferase [Jeotgalicoccus coquinae]|uniref:PPK2 family polyphosphate:nucleotide phosphotransferase n=1 Tax=Jeotgalicoccus coquinae TaxID=709509 RepID=A0A6V7RQ44_9STAP|nr:PPK2 family polyphosphate kinase [Jeotgalicoccus coquinae]MBB6423920.1 PPK2 family polyphosphate:nucleotide phosphotransferase [Jeotgalicoccus coquinae]GGE23937.1 PPK2 family polyphosphate--nucleotide phosphotransferase [Jeotgalicoccus coquinae]CAD2080449.1 Polyphosphate kinase 2 (PPK2) [Jeotgalicoccus coquinae]
MNLSDYKVPSTKNINLKDYQTSEGKKEDNDYIKKNIIPPLVEQMKALHLKLHAEGKNGIMVVLQAIDAAGKDEAISYIFSNLNAQGLKVTTYGKPNENEQKHDYLWRLHDGEPERGQVAILNRSHYEDVIATRIHDLLEDGDAEIEKRYRQINNYEQYLSENGFSVVKFFFNMSKDEQKERFLKRMKDPDKQWEFSFSDVEERKKWDDYQKVFEDMLNNTSTQHSPWYILPADDEWHTRRIITEAMIHVLEGINPEFPAISGEDKKKLDKYIKELENE